MDSRSFTDRDGVRWKVSIVEPEVSRQGRERRDEPRAPAVKRSTADRLATRPIELPWLSFESKSIQMRVSIVPSDWKTMPDAELEDLMADATKVK